MTTAVTLINRAVLYLVMLCNLLTDRTFYAVRIALVLYPFKTSIIIREVIIKVLTGKLLLFAFLFHRNHPLLKYSIPE